MKKTLIFKKFLTNLGNHIFHEPYYSTKSVKKVYHNIFDPYFFVNKPHLNLDKKVKIFELGFDLAQIFEFF